MLPEHLVLVTEQLQLIRARKPLPDVPVARGHVQAAFLARRADHDRDPGLKGERGMPDVVELVLLAVMRDLPAGQQIADDGERLLEPVEPLPERPARVDPVGTVLELDIAGPEPQDRPPAADVVDRDRHLGHDTRIAERVGAD
jgi:hypothetical protein